MIRLAKEYVSQPLPIRDAFISERRCLIGPSYLDLASQLNPVVYKP
ncbi:MAG: hypothetical protein QXF26_05645 [Candidatus Bathyarchaeia archaeon]